MSRLVNPQAIEATRRESLSKDMSLADLMKLVLAELRIMNLHLEHLTDLDIEREDVELE